MSNREVTNKCYLGDSVYVYVDLVRGSFVLTTENGCGPTNTIFLEPSVYESLVAYVTTQSRELSPLADDEHSDEDREEDIRGGNDH